MAKVKKKEKIERQDTFHAGLRLMSANVDGRIRLGIEPIDEHCTLSIDRSAVNCELVGDDILRVDGDMIGKIIGEAVITIALP